LSTEIPLNISSILTFVPILLSVAFFTLIERKIMGLAHFRPGPNKVGFQGILQPFRDAIKLFSKETQKLFKSNHFTLNIAPGTIIVVYLSVWSALPNSSSKTNNKISFLLLITLISVSIFFLISRGWSSNSKFSLIGAYRSTAQTISYEITLLVILLPFVLALNIIDIDTNNNLIATPIVIIALIIVPAWVRNVLAETNRTPFDLRERESELVSGFNTEYSRGGFSIIFVAEYTAIIVIRVLTTIIFGLQNSAMPFYAMIIIILIIWSRVSFPRLRYDFLIYYSWKYLLTASVMWIALVIINIIVI